MRSDEIVCSECDGAGMITDSRASLRVRICHVCRGHGKRPIYKAFENGFERVLVGNYDPTEIVMDLAGRR